MYFAYYKYGNWQKHNPNPFPQIIFVTAKNKIKYILENSINNKLRSEKSIEFFLTTREAIQKNGITKKVLEKIIILYDTSAYTLLSGFLG